MGRFVVLLVLPACQLVFPLEDPDLPCDRGTAFSTGSRVPISGMHSVEGARFNPTQEVALLSLCPTIGSAETIKAGCDLFQAPFFRDTQTFGIPGDLGVSSRSYDAYPTVTPNLDFILFGSERTGGPQVFIAEAVNGGFGDAVPFALDLGRTFSNEPYVIGDGSVLFYSASPPEIAWDLYRASSGPPSYTNFQSVPGVNTDDHEFAPVVADDELEIFFASNRQAPNDDFALDVYTATRSSSEASFDPPTRVEALSTDGIDWPLWISPNGCELYYINKPYKNNAVQIGSLFLSRRPR